MTAAGSAIEVASATASATKLASAIAIVGALAFALLCVSVSTARADAEHWDGVFAGGGELSFGTELEGHGWVLFDALGFERVGDANLRLHVNTQKLYIAIERVSIVKHKFEFSLAATGELILAQLLTDYYVQGQRISEGRINASYVDLLPKFQWHFAHHQTLELTLGVRQWFFAFGNPVEEVEAAFGPNAISPDDFFAFSPRLGYIFWKVDSPSEEWQAHRFFPRIKGIAIGLSAGIDIRTDTTQWGFLSLNPARNEPDTPIILLRQWLRAGWEASPVTRLQFRQHAAYGWNEDDITRERVGGMNPYVLPIPGLPWAALVSERLFLAQVTLHLRARGSSPHEFGVALAGAAINDVYRRGELNTYGGTGGVGLFADLRFGRWQLDARVGYAFPVSWLAESPHFSAMLSAGVHAF